MLFMVDVPKIINELKQMRQEVERLRNLVEQHAADEKKAVANADRLQDENIMLLQQIERTIDEQKVALPREVYEAIDFLIERYSKRNVLAWILQGRLRGVNLNYDDKREKALSVIREYEFEDILIALVNGYTIEESFDDQIKSGIKRIINNYDDRFDSDLQTQIADFVREMYLQKS